MLSYFVLETIFRGIFVVSASLTFRGSKRDFSFVVYYDLFFRVQPATFTFKNILLLNFIWNTVTDNDLHNGGAALITAVCEKLHPKRVHVKSNLHFGWMYKQNFSPNLQLGNALHGLVGWINSHWSPLPQDG